MAFLKEIDLFHCWRIVHGLCFYARLGQIDIDPNSFTTQELKRALAKMKETTKADDTPEEKVWYKSSNGKADEPLTLISLNSVGKMLIKEVKSMTQMWTKKMDAAWSGWVPIISSSLSCLFSFLKEQEKQPSVFSAGRHILFFRLRPTLKFLNDIQGTYVKQDGGTQIL